MLSAQNSNGNILATEAVKEDGPFTCPMCGGIALLKQGRVKIHHFAHKPPTDCAYGAGESETHRKAKLDIYEALSKHPGVSKLKLERPLGEVRPDISFYLKDTPIAIEVQVSTLPLDTIDKRTKAYKNKGISLLWASPFSTDIQHGERYSPVQWEKYLHTLYFGKLYYWLEGETLQPVRFDDYKIQVELSSWHDSNGDEMYAGGYERYSKRYRTPRLLKPIDITSLTTVTRNAWASKTLTVPAARLWCEPRKS